jgi:RNase P subunit RPR2
MNMVVEVVGVDEKMLKRSTCKNCASILQYTLNDTVTYTAKDTNGNNEGYRYVTCPKCGTKIHIAYITD